LIPLVSWRVNARARHDTRLLTGDVMPTFVNTLTVPALAATALAAGIGVVVVNSESSTAHHVATVSVPAPSTNAAVGGTGLPSQIAQLQQRLRDVPGDWQSWGSLGFDYVQQARVTVDPTYYPKAQQVLRRSLELNATDNIIAMAGEAALSAARHDFRGALTWARRGLSVDPHNGVLLGALDDALTQLGDYAGAARAAAAMERADPGTAAEARLSYVAELRGDIRGAESWMRLALADAGTPADVAFTRYYLGDLHLGSGNAEAALADYSAGLAADPSYTALIDGRARAEVALGQTANALRDFATVVAEVPMPSYVVEYGELLQASGQGDAAAKQYALVRIEERLFRANGVVLDSDATLFEADHGSPAQAVAIGRAAIASRPFLDSYDAYGWALYRDGQDRAALAMVNRALRTGYHSALFRYHRGVIELALGQRAAGRADLRIALAYNPSFSPIAAPNARHRLAGKQQ